VTLVGVVEGSGVPDAAVGGVSVVAGADFVGGVFDGVALRMAVGLAIGVSVGPGVEERVGRGATVAVLVAGKAVGLGATVGLAWIVGADVALGFAVAVCVGASATGVTLTAGGPCGTSHPTHRANMRASMIAKRDR